MNFDIFHVLVLVRYFLVCSLHPSEKLQKRLFFDGISSLARAERINLVLSVVSASRHGFRLPVNVQLAL